MDPEELLLRQIGRHLRARRLSRGLSQESLAELAGLSPRYVSLLENGRANISVLRLAEIARALGVPLDELVRPAKDRRVWALIGLRGAGKSDVGRRLARALRRPFIELDRLIEEEAGLHLGEIFSMHGEAYYRQVERKVLERFLSSGRTAVLATGGGIVTDRVTYDLLKRNVLTVWLKARPQDHIARVAAQGDRRPTAGSTNPLAALETLLREREPLYAEAELTVDTSDRSPEQVTKSILEWGQA